LASTKTSKRGNTVERSQLSLPELGVGVVYSSGLEPLLTAKPGLIDVLEIEPQTTWIENPAHPGVIEARSDVDQHLAGLPGRKLVHSIGTPVGGSVDALEFQLPLLRDAVRNLGAPFASEHLAFNLTPDFFTGFFLPPRQTTFGIEIYKQAIARLRNAVGVPLAIETGVNYLKPRGDEIPDGEFVAQLVESADCGILLDLHNIYCNQLNGRQSMEKFLSQIPLEDVWEVHLAGGSELNGFWLDAHSGAIPEPLFEICRDVVPHLRNLKAIVFEMFSSFLPAFGLGAIERQLENLHSLWDLRRPAPCTAMAGPSKIARATSAAVQSGPTPQEWEQSLGRMAIGRTPVTPLEQLLVQDPGVPLVRELIHEFRASMVVTVYRLTSRLLMLTLTPDVFRAILQEYWTRFAPRQYSASEADGFYSFLVSKHLRVPWFQKVLEFERATMLTIIDGQSRVVSFSADPLPILRALAEGRLPDMIPQQGDYEIELKPEGPITVSGIELDEVGLTFPFH
jgi:uncharacterized protein (UPF0276 family)